MSAASSLLHTYNHVSKHNNIFTSMTHSEINLKNLNVESTAAKKKTSKERAMMNNDKPTRIRCIQKE